jgi:hypothetical protein
MRERPQDWVEKVESEDAERIYSGVSETRLVSLRSSQTVYKDRDHGIGLQEWSSLFPPKNWERCSALVLQKSGRIECEEAEMP